MFKNPTESPVIDMQGMVLMPYKMDFVDYHEEKMLISHPTSWPDQLRFKRFRDDQSYACVQMEEATFWQKLEKENVSGKLLLPRLCQNNSYYNSLFSLIPDLHKNFVQNEYEVVYEHIGRFSVDKLNNNITRIISYDYMPISLIR